MLGKKAQVATFMIIGLVILLGGVVVMLVRNIPSTEVGDIPTEITKGQLVPIEGSAIRHYIESCIKSVSEPLIKEIGYNGGTLNPMFVKKYPISGSIVDFRYLCIAQPGNGCVNRLTTRKSMEDELNGVIKLGLETCIDLDQFRRRGYSVSEGTKSVTTKIASTEVNIEIDLPIVISKEGFRIEVDHFSSIVRSELGKVFDLVVNMLNSEILYGYFDQDEWMRGHGGEIVIEKHKPYPHTVYRLTKFNQVIKEDYIFNFAIQGTDTVLEILIPSVGVDYYDFCNTDDGNCYANSEEAACNAIGGVYSETPSCGGVSLYSDSNCYGGVCNYCANREHGESWCVYDAPVGKGRDYVGSRHYKQTCINGRVFNTECRDYREELCTEDQSFNPKKAICRTNRWFDCVGQETAVDCLDDSERDCYWTEQLYDGTSRTLQRDIRCNPTVPPAFKHWEGREPLVCYLANEHRDCDGLRCPINWVEATARLCYMQGDCGNYRNIGDVMTYEGYTNTDQDPRDTTYPPLGKAGKTFTDVLQLRFNREVHNDSVGDPEWDLDSVVDGYGAYMDQVDRWKSQKTSLMLKAARGESLPIYTAQTAACGVWMAPDGGGGCEFCNEDSAKPCTEYRCKSLGKTCSYVPLPGYGICNSPSADDTQGPVIGFDASVLSVNYTHEESLYLDFDGVLITPGVEPYDTIQVGIKTDEEAICAYAPIPTDFEGASDLFGGLFTTTETIFSESHNFNFSIAPSNVIVDEISDTLDTFTVLPFSSLSYADDYISELREEAIDLVNEFGGDDDYLENIEDMYDSYENTLKPTLEEMYASFDDVVTNLLISSESGRQAYFFNCIDKSGNENEDIFFIEFTNKVDTEEPVILGSVPATNSTVADPMDLKIFVNEPAECKYTFDIDKSYNAMRYWMDCDTSVLGYGFIDDNFECSATIPFTADEHKLFVKCMDQPPTIKEYALHLIRGSDFGIAQSSIPSLINYSKALYLINMTSAAAIEDNETKMNVDVDTIRIAFRLDTSMDDAECRYDTKPGRFDDLVDVYNCEGRNCVQTFFPSSDMSIYIRCKKYDAVSVTRNVNAFSYPLVFRRV